MRQATMAAALFEFLGAVLVGARVSSTIKNGIVPASIFEGNAGLQLLAFVNAIFVSSIWLSIATRLGWPVSTTYSIVSAVAGVGIACGGFDAPQWGWNGGSGLGAIFAGLVIAPLMAAGFASTVYLLVKFIVLVRKDATRWALYTGPFWFMVVACVCTMSIVYKGSPSLNLDDMSPGKTAAAILLTGFVVGLLAAVFWLPFVYGKVIKKDYSESASVPSNLIPSSEPCTDSGHLACPPDSPPMVPLFPRTHALEPSSSRGCRLSVRRQRLPNSKGSRPRHDPSDR
jgi:sodium-dependent phosphate transporter